MDWPKSQTDMECFHACAAYFWGFHNSLPIRPIQPKSPTTKEHHESAIQSPQHEND